MKPITNILLILALVCYVFLPFYNITFQGGINGIEFTAGVISRTGTLKGLIFALIPFIAGFLAISFNVLKNKRWAIASMLLIFAGLYFYHATSNFHEFALVHTPEVAPADGVGEGFSIEGLSWGYWLSCAFMVLAFFSSALSMMPFKFNERIERAVDDTIDEVYEGGKKHIVALGHEMHDEWSKHRKHKMHETPTETPTEAPKPDNNSRFMPGAPADDAPASQPESTDKEDHSRFMPKS